MHYKRKKPRTKSTSVGAFPNGNPSHWNILFHNRPKRRRNKRSCHRILAGADADYIAWDLGNRKPVKWYW